MAKIIFNFLALFHLIFKSYFLVHSFFYKNNNLDLKIFNFWKKHNFYIKISKIIIKICDIFKINLDIFKIFI